MSDQFSLLKFGLRNAPALECRSILTSITAAHLAGLPLQAGEAQIAVNLQKIPERIRKHFGEIPIFVVEPELKKLSSDCFAFPKIEHVALLFAPKSSEGLAVVWYEFDPEPMMSENTRRKIEGMDWKAVSGPF